MLLNTTPFPKRVYQPARGWTATALRQESPGVLVKIDREHAELLEWPENPDEAMTYVPESVLVEVESEVTTGDVTELRLVDGRIVLMGRAELSPEGNDAVP